VTEYKLYDPIFSQIKFAPKFREVKTIKCIFDIKSIL